MEAYIQQLEGGKAKLEKEVRVSDGETGDCRIFVLGERSEGVVSDGGEESSREAASRREGELM